MIDFIKKETARKLRDAGLQWEPEILDCYVFDENDIEGIDPDRVCFVTKQADAEELRELKHAWYPRFIKTLWLPRWEQILAAIEKLDLQWETGLTTSWGGPMAPRKHKSYYWFEIIEDAGVVKVSTKGTSPLEAAANAYLEILMEGKE